MNGLITCPFVYSKSEAGVIRLVRPDQHRIVTEAECLLHHREVYRTMAQAGSLLGDSRAAERIMNIAFTS